uniref:CSON015386 protein n=1 Tax=Culicoides sonorensis TaxID=179676 RepID=A0A336MD72_CULSO
MDFMINNNQFNLSLCGDPLSAQVIGRLLSFSLLPDLNLVQCNSIYLNNEPKITFLTRVHSTPTPS